MAARKRSEALAETVTAPEPAKAEVKPKELYEAGSRYPMENDLSAMCIRLKRQKGYRVPVSTIAGWSPQERHVVATWLERLVSDAAAIVQSFPRTEERPEEP